MRISFAEDESAPRFEKDHIAERTPAIGKPCDGRLHPIRHNNTIDLGFSDLLEEAGEREAGKKSIGGQLCAGQEASRDLHL